MIYSLSIFGKTVSVVPLNYDVISIQTAGPIEKCGRTVFEIVLFTDDIETIKKGLLQFVACYNNFPVYSFSQVDFNNKLYILLFEKYELSFVDEVFIFAIFPGKV